VNLLLDNNLSPFLLQSLKTDFPDSLHCADVQLQRSDDLAIWNYAKENHFAIVTKDSDFNALVTLFGFPPHIVWIRRGNCSTKEIERLLHGNTQVLHSFLEQSQDGLLILR